MHVLSILILVTNAVQSQHHETFRAQLLAVPYVYPSLLQTAILDGHDDIVAWLAGVSSKSLIPSFRAGFDIGTVSSKNSSDMVTIHLPISRSVNYNVVILFTAEVFHSESTDL